MIKVNSYLNDELNKDFRQGITYEISMATFDRAFTSNAIIENSGSPLDAICGDMYDVPMFFEGITQVNEYTSFEPNIYDVDNPKKLFRDILPGESDIEYAKNYGIYVISRDFYTEPTTKEAPFFEKTILLSDLPALYKPYKMSGITIQFGEDKQIYPTHVILEFYNETGNLMKTIEDYPKGNLYSILFSLVGVYKIKLKVLEMSKRGVKLRVSNVMSGTEVTFNDEIVSVDVKRSSSPFGTELPRTECSVSLYDEYGLFDPQNPNGIYYSLNKPEIKLYCICNGTKELVGTYIMADAPTTSGKEVKIKGIGTQMYNISSSESTIAGTDGASMWSLMDNALLSSFADIDGSYLSDNVPYYLTGRNYSYIKNEKPKNVVTKIANATFGMITEDKTGKVKIKTPILPSSKTNIDFELDSTKILGKIDLDTSTPILRTFSVQKYANDGSGKKIENSVYGEGLADFKIDNNYIVTEDVYNFLRGCFDTWIKETQKYKVPYMSDPRIEVGDVISFKNEYGTHLYGIIAENDYSYPNDSNGSLIIYTIPKSAVIGGK